MSFWHLYAFDVPLKNTDAQGVLYHGEYLGFADQARTQYLKDQGYPVTQWRADGVSFVVRDCQVRFRSPLFFDDHVQIQSCIKEIQLFRVVFQQIFCKNQRDVASLLVTIVCLGKDGKIQPVPGFLTQILAASNEDA